MYCSLKTELIIEYFITNSGKNFILEIYFGGYLHLAQWFQTIKCILKTSPWAPSWTACWWSSRWWSWWSCWGRCRAWQCGRRWLWCHWTCSCVPVPEERWSCDKERCQKSWQSTWHSAKVESLENSSRQRMTLGMFSSRNMQTMAMEIWAWETNVL